MRKFRVVSCRFVIPIVVVAVCSLAAPSSALGQLHLWGATAAVPAGITPDDALFVFTGTGGTIAGVAWNAAGSTCPAPVAIVPSPAPGVANEVPVKDRVTKIAKILLIMTLFIKGSSRTMYSSNDV